MKQSSREALIDLLFLALYLDDHLSLAEDEVLTKALDSLGWDSAEPREIHIWHAFSKARDGASCELKTIDFLDAHAATIRDDGGAAEAMTWLSRVLAADGLSPSEKQFLKRLENVLFPQS